ncbi:nicotinamidase-related amidase [Rhizobium sp. RAS22]|nr:nicotinamidase-related amidase [Rhizobium sp. RAS22]
MHVIHASLKFEPTFKVLGEAKYGLRKMMRDHGAFLGERADFFPGFEPAAGEHVVRERAGSSSAFIGTTLDGYLRNNRVEDIYLSGF